MDVCDLMRQRHKKKKCFDQERGDIYLCHCFIAHMRIDKHELCSVFCRSQKTFWLAQNSVMVLCVPARMSSVACEEDESTKPWTNGLLLV